MTLPDAKALYEGFVLLAKAPHHEGPLAGATHDATTSNPLCGDRVTLHAIVDGDAVRVVTFEARGCMIARASAALLTDVVAGHSIRDALALASRVEAIVAPTSPARDENLGVLEPLRAAREFPARRSCVTLAWHALAAALPSARASGKD